MLSNGLVLVHPFIGGGPAQVYETNNFLNEGEARVGDCSTSSKRTQRLIPMLLSISLTESNVLIRLSRNDVTTE